LQGCKTRGKEKTHGCLTVGARQKLVTNKKEETLKKIIKMVLVVSVLFAGVFTAVRHFRKDTFDETFS
jgi:hypothetical protein